MLEISLPGGDGSLSVRSFAACLASVTETQPAHLPLTEDDWGESIGRWRQWLAGRGLGLVELANAQRFNWPGYWIAIVEDHGTSAEEVAVLLFGTPAGAVLSPASPDLVGHPLESLVVKAGYVIAALDPSAAKPVSGMKHSGVVEAIAVADEKTAPMHVVATTHALAGRGLQGDRYANKAGTFTPRDATGRGYDLTLIEAEVLDQLVLPSGERLSFADSRRNVLTRGVDLNALVGRRFRIDDVECVGQRYCEPCAHLERLTQSGVIRGLIHRGGLRADVVTDGALVVGATVDLLP